MTKMVGLLFSTHHSANNIASISAVNTGIWAKILCPFLILNSLSHPQDPLIHLYKCGYKLSSCCRWDLTSSSISPDFFPLFLLSIHRSSSGSGISHDGTTDWQTGGPTLILTILIRILAHFGLCCSISVLREAIEFLPSLAIQLSRTRCPIRYRRIINESAVGTWPRPKHHCQECMLSVDKHKHWFTDELVVITADYSQPWTIVRVLLLFVPAKKNEIELKILHS